jgi:PAS domain S-box-containing protein
VVWNLSDQHKTKKLLISELEALRRVIIELKTNEVDSQQVGKMIEASETRYRRLFEAAKDGILILDAETGRILDVNHVIINLLGYSHSEILGKHLWELNAFKAIAATKAAFVELQANDDIRNEDLQLTTKDGHNVNVEFYNNAYLVDNHKVIQCNIRDISDRKQTENALLETNTRHSAMIENIGDVIAIVGADGMTKYQSPNIERWFGWKPADLFGTNGWDKMHPGDVERIQKEFIKMLDKETASTVEYRFKCKDGSYKWIELTAVNRINEPAINGVLINYHDITERKQSEETVRKILHSLQQAEAIADLGYFERNWQTGEGYWSEGFYRLLGVPPEYVDCKHEDFMTYIHADDRERVTAHIGESLAKKFEMDVEFRLVRADGPIIVIHGIGRNFYDGQGKILSTIGTFQNITEHKKAEEEKLNLARFPSENPNPVLRIKDDGTIVFANQSSSPLLELWECKIGECLSPDWNQFVLDAIDQGKQTNTEIVCGEKTFAVTYAPIPDSDYLNVYGLDITERILKDEEITKLAKFPSENPNPVLRIARDGTILYSNDASIPLLEFWNILEDELFTTDWHQFVLDALNTGVPQQAEVNFGGKNISLTFSPVIGSDFVNVYGLDITDLKMAADEIERLAKFPSENPNPVMRIDKDGTILYVNESSSPILELWDCSKGECLSPEWHRFSLDALRTGKPQWTEAQSRDRTFSLTYAPVPDSDYINVYALDITELKKLEHELKQYSQHLEEMINERTKELEEAQELVIRNEKLATLGQLAGGVSHDLRNPLGVIGNSVFYLNMILGDKDENVTKHIGIIQGEIKRSNAIITDLLEFSKVKKPDIEQIEVDPFIHKILTGIDAIPETISITTHFDESLPVISMDQGQMERVFNNLFSNAVQSMPDGGVLTVESGKKGDWAEIRIRDSGEGIPEENFQKIFEPLFTTKARGIGLGLSIAKSIIDAHHGVIDVESTIDGGTTFTIRLPTKDSISKKEDD